MTSGPILRHGAATSGEVAEGDAEAHALVQALFEQELGAAVDHVFHEIVSDLVHVDVHHVPPSGQRDFHALFTTGMSDRRMTVPLGAPSTGYAELAVFLPSEWKLDAASFRDERWYWPVRWLKTLARLPHAHATWLGDGHTIPNGDPPKPFAEGTLLSGICLRPLVNDQGQIMAVQVDEEKDVEIFELYPFTTAEMDLKLQTSAAHVLKGIGKAGGGRVVQHDRACSVTGAKPSQGRGFFQRWFGR